MKNNKKIIILSVVVLTIYVLFNVLFNKIASLNPEIIIFDMQVFYSPATFYANIALYTPEIERYLLIFRYLDMVFLVTYTLLIIQIFKKYQAKYLIYPLVTLGSDLIENLLLAYKMFINQTYNRDIIYLINAITTLKFVTLLASFGIIITLAAKAKKQRYNQ